jgi:hypothetical protein
LEIGTVIFSVLLKCGPAQLPAFDKRRSPIFMVEALTKFEEAYPQVTLLISYMMSQLENTEGPNLNGSESLAPVSL